MFIFFFCFFLVSCFDLFELKIQQKKNGEISESIIFARSENEVEYMEEIYGKENVVRSYLTSEEFRRTVEVEELAKLNEKSLIHSLKYFSLAEVSFYLQNLSSIYSDISEYGVIGETESHQLIEYVKIGNTKTNKLKPEVIFIANIHGDESVGLVLMVKLVDFLCSTYYSNTSSSFEVRNFLDEMNIYIIPTMNPFGYSKKCRSNPKKKDLNRNFPDQFLHPSFFSSSSSSERRRSIENISKSKKKKTKKSNRALQPFQQETKLMMDFPKDKNIVFGSYFHGGAQVVSYPYDGNSDGLFHRPGAYSKSQFDDLLFQHLSLRYIIDNEHFGCEEGDPKQKKKVHSCEFPSGMTNGAKWYALYGGLQDFYLRLFGIKGLTVELSNRKWPSTNSLNGFWNQNIKSFLNLMKETLKLTIKGTIIRTEEMEKEEEKKMVENVLIRIHRKGDKKAKSIVRTNPNGEFATLLMFGTYEIQFIYEEKEDSVITKYEKKIEVEVNRNQIKPLDFNFDLRKDFLQKTEKIEKQKKGPSSSFSSLFDLSNSFNGTYFEYLFVNNYRWINTSVGLMFFVCCCGISTVMWLVIIFGCLLVEHRRSNKGGGGNDPETIIEEERYFPMGKSEDDERINDDLGRIEEEEEEGDEEEEENDEHVKKEEEIIEE